MSGGGDRSGLRRWWRSARSSEWRVSTNIIAVLMVLLAGFTAVQGYVQDDRTDRLTVCLTAYADGFADALDARSDANADAQGALDDLMVTVGAVLTRAEDRGQLVAAVQEYLRQRAEAKKTQAENPYPPAPRDACEEAR